MAQPRKRENYVLIQNAADKLLREVFALYMAPHEKNVLIQNAADELFQGEFAMHMAPRKVGNPPNPKR